MVADSDNKEEGLLGELPMSVHSQSYCDCLPKGGGGRNRRAIGAFKKRKKRNAKEEEEGQLQYSE